MKRNSQTNPQPTNTVDDLRAQLDSIAAVLAIETDRDKAARIEAAEAARVEREAAERARVDAAVARCRKVTTTVLDELLRMDAGVFKDLDAAVQACGYSSVPPESAVVWQVRQVVTTMIDRLEMLKPAVVDPAAELESARAELARAEKQLATLRAAFGVPESTLETALRWQARARGRVAELTNTPVQVVNVQRELVRLVRYPGSAAEVA